MVMYIISNASECDGELKCHDILIRQTYEDAIITIQNSIAADYGYSTWNEYLAENDPAINEQNGVYTLYDNYGNHQEYYRIDRVKT